MKCQFCGDDKRKLFRSLITPRGPAMWCGRCPEGLKVKIDLLRPKKAPVK